MSQFVERARKVKANFALTENNSRAVMEVCQRLDGVPLAIELAAERVIALSPAELAQRLDRRFQVLAGDGGAQWSVTRHCEPRSTGRELLGEAERDYSRAWPRSPVAALLTGPIDSIDR